MTRRLVEELPRVLQSGATRALSDTQIWEMLRVPDAEADLDQLHMAVDVLRERGVPIGFTESGYFIVETEEDRQQCLSDMNRKLERSLAELKRIESWRVGEGRAFPTDPRSST